MYGPLPKQVYGSRIHASRWNGITHNTHNCIHTRIKYGKVDYELECDFLTLMKNLAH
jgi:hypothetical protein